MQGSASPLPAPLSLSDLRACIQTVLLDEVQRGLQVVHVTVILRALDRVRGRALGLLGSGSPRSLATPGVAWCRQAYHQFFLNRREMVGGPVIHDFATALSTVRGSTTQDLESGFLFGVVL